MLIPFVIDSDSLAPDSEWSPQTQRACYNDFIDAWMEAGLLAVDGDKIECSILFKSINSIPEKYRKRIQELMKRCPIRCIPDWKGSINNYCDLGVIAPDAKLALVDDIRAELEFGLSAEDDEILNPETKVTVCRFQLFRHSQVIRDYEFLASAHIVRGDKFLDIWNKRFLNLAIAPIRHINIVDRFAVSRHFNTSQAKLSGLERFLKLLNEYASGDRNVTIYSAWTDELQNIATQGIKDELFDLKRKYSHKIKKIEIYMAPNGVFKKDAHDRFISFHISDCHQYVWDLGEGLTVFEGPCSEVKSSAKFIAGPVPSYQNVKKDIVNSKDTKLIRCDVN